MLKNDKNSYTWDCDGNNYSNNFKHIKSICVKKWFAPKNNGSTGVDKCIFPSLLTESSINHDLFPSENVKISCTELFAVENKNTAACPLFGCFKVTTSGVPLPVYSVFSDNSNASSIITS